MSILTTLGELLRNLADWLTVSADFILYIGLAIGLALLLLRFLTDALKLNPFGRFYQAARRPTDQWFFGMRNSQFYYPLKQAFGFDPVWLMLVLAFVLLFVLMKSMVSYVTTMLNFIALTLIQFGIGNLMQGAQALLGTLLIAFIYFLMALMTILVIYSWFGFFSRAAYWAGQRIYPLLNSVDPSGRYAPIIFILAFILLQYVAGAVAAVFFRTGF